MRRSMIRRWALPAVFWLAIEDGAKFSAEVPPGPKWLQTAVFYQIYPQSYYDSNGDGIGDLPGITAKLDYISSIGCNAIWLNPIFESPFGDAGYDVADFYKVAARYGTNDDFKYLCAEVHKRGMHVCVDLVAGHSSIANSWFQQSALDWRNRYSNWYIWTPAAENVTGSQLYPGQDRRPERYLPNFFPFQPALNYGYMPRPTWGRNDREVRTIFAMLLTMPGVPFIYYGDEIGMKFLPELPNKEGGTLGKVQRCGSRTPMQWSREKNAGFSTAPADELYLPIDSAESRPNVASEENDPASMLNFTRELFKLRHEHPALANAADFQPLYAETNKYPFVYLRVAGTERIIVAINPAERACTATLGEVIKSSRFRPLLVQGAVFHDRYLDMDPISFGIFLIE